MPQEKPILARQRQELILDHVRSDGAVRVQDLTDLLQVSDMTVRRDLDALARRGLVEKVHGGATLSTDATSDEPSFESKTSREPGEKAAIAAQATRLVAPGSAIALSAGTTTWTLANYLFPIPDLTIVTNSPRIADLLYSDTAARRTVILTGGVRTPSQALVGPVAERAIRSLHVDVLFIGCHGIHADAGLTTPNLAESETNKQFIHTANKVVVVADHTKWGVVGLSSFGDLRDVDVLITGEHLPAAALASAQDRIATVVLAREEAADGAKYVRENHA